MKLITIKILILIITSVYSDISPLTTSKESVNLLKTAVTNDLVKDFGKKFTKIAKFAGPIGEVASFVLGIFVQQEDHTEEYLKNITHKLEVIDGKIDGVSKQISHLDAKVTIIDNKITLLDAKVTALDEKATILDGKVSFLDAKLTQAVKKIITEAKFRDFVLYFEELKAQKQDFETIIASFETNSTLLVYQLDKFIDDYRKRASDAKLVNILDSGAGIFNSIVDDLIILSRSFYEENSDPPKSSTVKIIYEIYLTVLMAVLKSNIILEGAVNLKTAVTGNIYEEDRRYNYHRSNKIYTEFFESIQKAFNKLNDDDLETFLDFSVNGESNQVRMINVLQVFWDKKYKDQICSDCNLGIIHKADGCYGSISNCYISYHQVTNLQIPQIDRIYLSVSADLVAATNPDYYKLIHLHCICDQFLNDKSVRKIYAGKISAPEGYVVTGVRFIERFKAIYPQIQVGKLLPMATINQDSIYWLDVENYNNFITFNNDSRHICFGDPKLMKFSDAVVTGIQFENKENCASWTIYGCKILDFNGGILGEEQQIQTNEVNGNFYGDEKIPGLSVSSKKFINNVNIRVIFGISNYYEDYGQSFVPYFDGNEVSFDIKAPLSGIGLIHYTNDEKYAGYIRPVVRSLDYRKYFNTSFQPDPFFLPNIRKFIANSSVNEENSSINKESFSVTKKNFSAKMYPGITLIPFMILIITSY